MLTDRDIEFLRELSVFAGLRADVVRSIADHANRIELERDEVVFEEGAPAKEMLVVLEGAISVIKTADTGKRSCIATLGPGDVAGEMSLIDIQPRSAELRTTSPSAVISISHNDLANMYREDKPSYTLLVLNIAREISIRLRRLDAALANIMAEIQSVTGSQPVRGERTTPPAGLFSGTGEARPRVYRETIPAAAGLPTVPPSRQMLESEPATTEPEPAEGE